MCNFITDYLYNYFDEVTPKEFYRDIFPVGSFEKKGEYTTGKYNAIAIEIGKKSIRKYLITDELSKIDYLLKSNNFIIISPISYCGKSRKSENARHLYALAIDLDGIKTEQHLTDLFYQIENEVLPKPTYVVSSGNGVHLYYVFKKPIALYKDSIKGLRNLRNDLIKSLWNRYTTTLYNNVQYESLFQGFRLVGGVTKNGSRTRAFLTGAKVDIDYLNSFVTEDKNKVTELKHKSNKTLAEAKELWPNWYDRVVLKKKKPERKAYSQNRGAFDRCYERIKREKKVGHRYFCIMILSITAKKCGISEKELREKALSLLPIFDAISDSEDNRFTKEDILKALESFNDDYIRMTLDTQEKLCGLKWPRNKRNFRKQETHLKIARATLQVLNSVNENNLQGRPTKADIIKDWRKQNPTGTKYQCIKETGISKPTVYKWWDKK